MRGVRNYMLTYKERLVVPPGIGKDYYSGGIQYY